MKNSSIRCREKSDFLGLHKNNYVPCDAIACRDIVFQKNNFTLVTDGILLDGMLSVKLFI